MTEVVVEAAKSDDVAHIADVVREVFEPLAVLYRPTALRWTADQVSRQPDQWLVARGPDGLVGVVRHHEVVGGHSLDALAVLPGVRRCGVGSALVAGVEHEARIAAATCLVIALRTSVSENAAFFAAHGYERSGSLSPEHALWAKQLTEPSGW